MNKQIISWFSITRIILIVWNVIAYLYHYLFIGIDGWTSIIIQVAALFTELAIAGWYEKSLIYGNEMIQRYADNFSSNRTLHILLPKYIIYTILFAGFYGITYTLRLLFFYWIGWGVNEKSFVTSISNMLFFALLAGWIMGVLVLWRKKRLKKII